MADKIFIRQGTWYRASEKQMQSDIELSEIIADVSAEYPEIEVVAGGGFRTLQQVIDASAVLTKNNTIGIDGTVLKLEVDADNYIRIEDTAGDGLYNKNSFYRGVDVGMEETKNYVGVFWGVIEDNFAGDHYIEAAQFYHHITNQQLDRTTILEGNGITLQMTQKTTSTGDVLASLSVNSIGTVLINKLGVSKNLSGINAADDFANDAAAETGGILVGDLYHSAGVVKIRLS